MSGMRERQTSPHSVAVVLNTPTSGTGMGKKDNWSLTGVTLPCLLTQLSASDDALTAAPALSQADERTVWRVWFPTPPTLDGNLNRLKIVTPAAHAGKLLRIAQPVVDDQLLGRSIHCVCEELTRDRQTSPLVAAGARPAGGRGARRG